MNHLTHLVIPIDEYARSIEGEFGELLLPSPPGIYSNFSNVTKRYYQHHDGRGGVVFLNSVSEINPKLPVYSDEGETISPVALKHANPLSDRPVISPYALLMVMTFAEIELDASLKWITHPRRLHDIFPEYLLINNTAPQYHVLEERVRSILMNLSQDIARYIDSRIWNIFLVRIRGMNLIIENKGDYRIDEWTRLKNEGRI